MPEALKLLCIMSSIAIDYENRKGFVKTKAKMKILKDSKKYLSQYVTEWLENSDTTEEEIQKMNNDLFTEVNNITKGRSLQESVQQPAA